MKTRSNAGSGLLAVLFTMSLLATLVATVFAITGTQVSNARRTASRTTAVAFADAVMENLYEQWRTAMVNITDSTDRASGLSTTALAGTLAAPSTTTLPRPSGVTLGTWSVVAATPFMAATTAGDGRPVPENGTASRTRIRLHYVAEVNVNFSTSNGQQTVTLRRDFVRGGKNIFDNFFFGTQPNTEFHPGPAMYVSGTVYVGGNLFTAHDSLHFVKDVTVMGTHTMDFRTEDSRYGTEVPNITNGGVGDNWDTNNPPHSGQQQKLLDTAFSGLDANFTDDVISNDTDSDGNLNNDGFHELIEEKSATGSDPLQLDTATSERLANNSDYRVYVDASNTVSIYKGASTTALSTTGAEYAAIRGALTVNTALRDVRDGDNVRLVTVDVGKITLELAASRISDNVGSGDGLMFYVKDSSNGTSVSTNVVNSANGTTTAVTSSRSRGVKLVNGAVLPGGGLSIVSPNMVYIQGDYNTGTTSSSQPASNTTSSYTPPVDAPSPNVAGYTRALAVVAGDAVNILSNSWNDANSLLGQSSRVATPTTINTAIVAGNVPTTTSSYSGGIENFTRFHENWSGVYLTLYGALALLYNSEQATRPWNQADYGAPSRRWFYDSLLQNGNPPGFRVARVYERGRWLQR